MAESSGRSLSPKIHVWHVSFVKHAHFKAVVISVAPNPIKNFKRFTFCIVNLVFESTNVSVVISAITFHTKIKLSASAYEGLGK